MGIFTNWFKKQPEYKEPEEKWDCEVMGHAWITDNRIGKTECLMCKKVN